MYEIFPTYKCLLVENTVLVPANISSRIRIRHDQYAVMHNSKAVIRNELMWMTKWQAEEDVTSTKLWLGNKCPELSDVYHPPRSHEYIYIRLVVNSQRHTYPWEVSYSEYSTVRKFLFCNVFLIHQIRRLCFCDSSSKTHIGYALLSYCTKSCGISHEGSIQQSRYQLDFSFTKGEVITKKSLSILADDLCVGVWHASKDGQ